MPVSAKEQEKYEKEARRRKQAAADEHGITARTASDSYQQQRDDRIQANLHLLTKGIRIDNELNEILNDGLSALDTDGKELKGKAAIDYYYDQNGLYYGEPMYEMERQPETFFKMYLMAKGVKPDTLNMLSEGPGTPGYDDAKEEIKGHLKAYQNIIFQADKDRRIDLMAGIYVQFLTAMNADKERIQDCVGKDLETYINTLAPYKGIGVSGLNQTVHYSHFSGMNDANQVLYNKVNERLVNHGLDFDWEHALYFAETFDVALISVTADNAMTFKNSNNITQYQNTLKNLVTNEKSLGSYAQHFKPKGSIQDFTYEQSVYQTITKMANQYDPTPEVLNHDLDVFANGSEVMDVDYYKDLSNRMQSNVRTGIFGGVKENSPEYKAVLDAFRNFADASDRYQQPGHATKQGMKEQLEQILNACRSYMSNHNPNSKQGKERYQMVMEAMNIAESQLIPPYGRPESPNSERSEAKFSKEKSLTEEELKQNTERALNLDAAQKMHKQMIELNQMSTKLEKDMEKLLSMNEQAREKIDNLYKDSKPYYEKPFKELSRRPSSHFLVYAISQGVTVDELMEISRLPEEDSKHQAFAAKLGGLKESFMAGVTEPDERKRIAFAADMYASFTEAMEKQTPSIMQILQKGSKEDFVRFGAIMSDIAQCPLYQSLNIGAPEGPNKVQRQLIRQVNTILKEKNVKSDLEVMYNAFAPSQGIFAYLDNAARRPYNMKEVDDLNSQSWKNLKFPFDIIAYVQSELNAKALQKGGAPELSDITPEIGATISTHNAIGRNLDESAEIAQQRRMDNGVHTPGDLAVMLEEKIRKAEKILKPYSTVVDQLKKIDEAEKTNDPNVLKGLYQDLKDICSSCLDKRLRNQNLPVTDEVYGLVTHIRDHAAGMVNNPVRKSYAPDMTEAKKGLKEIGFMPRIRSYDRLDKKLALDLKAEKLMQNQAAHEQKQSERAQKAKVFFSQLHDPETKEPVSNEKLADYIGKAGTCAGLTTIDRLASRTKAAVAYYQFKHPEAAAMTEEELMNKTDAHVIGDEFCQFLHDNKFYTMDGDKLQPYIPKEGELSIEDRVRNMAAFINTAKKNTMDHIMIPDLSDRASLMKKMEDFERVTSYFLDLDQIQQPMKKIKVPGKENLYQSLVQEQDQKDTDLMLLIQSTAVYYREVVNDNSKSFNRLKTEEKRQNEYIIDLKSKTLAMMLLEENLSVMQKQKGASVSDLKLDPETIVRTTNRNQMIYSSFRDQLTEGLTEEEMVNYLSGSTPRPEKMNANLKKIEPQLNQMLESMLPNEYRKQVQQESMVRTSNYKEIEKIEKKTAKKSIDAKKKDSKKKDSQKPDSKKPDSKKTEKDKDKKTSDKKTKKGMN